jgi:hypothetical protein
MGVPTPDLSFIDTSVELLLNPAHPHDSLALLPFVGAPFAYNQFRMGRGSWLGTGVSAAIGIGFTQGIFWGVGRAAGFTSIELFLGRGLGALGFTYGGRFMGFSGMLLGPSTAAEVGWRIPHWVAALAMYEYGTWFGNKVSTAHNRRDEFGKPVYARDW